MRYINDFAEHYGHVFMVGYVCTQCGCYILCDIDKARTGVGWYYTHNYDALMSFVNVLAVLRK